MDLITAYRTLIATAKERKTENLYFIEPHADGKEADAYHLTVRHSGSSAWDWEEIEADGGYAGPEDVGHPVPVVASIGICENLKFLVQLPGEYAGTPECIRPALDEFQQILDLLNDLGARVASLEAHRPANDRAAV